MSLSTQPYCHCFHMEPKPIIITVILPGTSTATGKIHKQKITRMSFIRSLWIPDFVNHFKPFFFNYFLIHDWFCSSCPVTQKIHPSDKVLKFNPLAKYYPYIFMYFYTILVFPNSICLTSPKIHLVRENLDVVIPKYIIPLCKIQLQSKLLGKTWH